MPRTKHGDAARDHRSKLYSVWLDMRNRCNNPKHKSSRLYHHRGVRVCSEWNEYRAFKRWALMSGYVPGYQLDRIESSDDYCPANCQWLPHADHVVKTALERVYSNQHGFRGVCKHHNGFRARVYIGGKAMYSRKVETAAEAAKEYNKMAMEQLGESAKLNAI